MPGSAAARPSRVERRVQALIALLRSAAFFALVARAQDTAIAAHLGRVREPFRRVELIGHTLVRLRVRVLDDVGVARSEAEVIHRALIRRPRRVADARDPDAHRRELRHALPVLLRRLATIAAAAPASGVAFFARGCDARDRRRNVPLAELGELAIARLRGFAI